MKQSRVMSHSLLRHCRAFHQNPTFMGLLLKPEPVDFSPSIKRIAESSNFVGSNFQQWNCVNCTRGYTSFAPESKMVPSERVSGIVDEISGLTLLGVANLTEVLRKKLEINEMLVMAMMMPGMGFGVKGAAKGGGAATGEEKVVEKTDFDLKLEGGCDAGAKIKIIKEVRGCADLGLKEAKDLVEKAPTLLKKGVLNEEAQKIIEKM